MTFHMPGLVEFLALVVIAFVAGFAWAAGATVFGRLFGKHAR